MLLRFAPLGDRRAEVEADLLELFAERTGQHGLRYARGDTTATSSACGEIEERSCIEPIPDAPPHLVREAAQDVTYALRLLRRSPAVVAVAVLGLGLAIGVGTSAFTLLTAVTFPATGIDDPPSAVRVMRAYENGSGTSWRYSEYHLLREGARRATVDAWFRDDTSIAYVASAEAPASTSVTFATGGYLASLNRRTTARTAVDAGRRRRRRGTGRGRESQPVDADPVCRPECRRPAHLVERRAIHHRRRDRPRLYRHERRPAHHLGTDRQLSPGRRRPGRRPQRLDRRERRRPAGTRRGARAGPRGTERGRRCDRSRSNRRQRSDAHRSGSRSGARPDQPW